MNLKQPPVKEKDISTHIWTRWFLDLWKMVDSGTLTDLPTYANNAAAILGGLSTGDFYRTATGVLMIVYTP